jgi:hypothetical protein
MESPRVAKWCGHLGRAFIVGAVLFLILSFIHVQFERSGGDGISRIANDFYGAIGSGVAGCLFLWIRSSLGQKICGISQDSRLNQNDPVALAAAQSREQEVLRCFWISCLMLIIPIAEVYWLVGLSNAPAWLENVRWLVPSLWLVSGVVGLYFGIRSCRLASRKTNGFGILAAVLHLCSLMILAVLSVPNGG